ADADRGRRVLLRARYPRRARHPRERRRRHGVLLRVGAGPRPPLLGPGRDPRPPRGQDDGRVRPRLVGRRGEARHAAPGGDGRGDPRRRRRPRAAWDLSMSDQTSRDAMVAEPTTLSVSDSAQDAGACFAEREDVRAVFVVEDDGRLAGVITRKTLVREVVAAGRPPTE